MPPKQIHSEQKKVAMGGGDLLETPPNCEGQKGLFALFHRPSHDFLKKSISFVPKEPATETRFIDHKKQVLVVGVYISWCIRVRVCFCYRNPIRANFCITESISPSQSRFLYCGVDFMNRKKYKPKRTLNKL